MTEEHNMNDLLETYLRSLFNWETLDLLDTNVVEFINCKLVANFGYGYNAGYCFKYIVIDFRDGTIDLYDNTSEDNEREHFATFKLSVTL